MANPILDTVLNGFTAGDYALYSKDFDDTLKDAITDKKFSQVRDQMLKKIGGYESRRYFGCLEQGNITVVLWKGRFASMRTMS